MVKCIPIERSVFHEAWLNGYRLNAVDSMQRGPMDLIERSVFHAVRPNESQLNAVDSMQHGAMDVD